MNSRLAEVEINKQKYMPLLQAAELEFTLPSNILSYIAEHESHFVTKVIEGEQKSSAGAIGLMQFKPDTASAYAKRLGIPDKDKFLPQNEIREAGAYLSDFYRKFSRDPNPEISKNALRWALAAYNTGGASSKLHQAMDLARQGKDYIQALPRETQEYISTAAHKLGWNQYSNTSKDPNKIGTTASPVKDRHNISATQEIFENFAVLQGNLGALVGLPNSKKKFMAKFLLAVGKEHKIIRPGDEFSINSAR